MLELYLTIAHRSHPICVQVHSFTAFLELHTQFRTGPDLPKPNFYAVPENKRTPEHASKRDWADQFVKARNQFLKVGVNVVLVLLCFASLTSVHGTVLP